MNEERARRVAVNESLARQINETVVAMGRGQSDEFVITCECGDAGCSERIPVTQELYERAREEPVLFLLRPGHEQPDVETVVDQGAEWEIVRKIGLAAAIAEETGS